MKLYKYFSLLVVMMGLTTLGSDIGNKEIIKKNKIGLLIVATGKYIQFVDPLIKSANQFFCTNQDVTYFIFTDGKAPQADNIVSIYQSKLGWPYDTLLRYQMYAKQKNILSSFDYLYACDADMLFVDYVGDEILSDRVGTLHPGYVGTKGTYEKRIDSKACVKNHEGKYYFAGGFNGGRASNFLNMAEQITNNIKADFLAGVIAVWHDESHLNRYYIDNEPTLILSPSYCYWQNHVLPYTPRLIALDKNHAEFRK